MTLDWVKILEVAAIICGPGGLVIAVMTRTKTKADALTIIQAAAARQVESSEEEAIKWKTECHALRERLDELSGRVDEQDACQTSLQGQIAQLEIEKRALLEEVGKLRNRVNLLEQENQRLKCIADKVNA